MEEPPAGNECNFTFVINLCAVIVRFYFILKFSDQIVMTPKCKTSNSTTLIIERKSKATLNGDGTMHVAGGDHKGIVINKTAQSGKLISLHLSNVLCVAI